MREVSTDNMMNMDMIVERLRPQLEVTKEDIEPIIIMGLYHHRDLVGSPHAFIKGNLEEIYVHLILPGGCISIINC